jgi:hypothetical protein
MCLICDENSDYGLRMVVLMVEGVVDNGGRRKSFFSSFYFWFSLFGFFWPRVFVCWFGVLLSSYQ